MNIWVIQGINYTLSFLMWAIVGRGFLRMITGNRQSIFMNAFIKLTEPVYNITRKLVPFAKGGWIPVISFILIFAVRLSIIIIFQPGTNR
ncbi:MAG: YggT family protein [Nitrospirae bacterium]|nr:YggT family protein [Nitrospirota bacterium]